MRKFSQITESVWNDMRKRSLGDSVKKEDDVNNLNVEEFCDYLNSKYDVWSLNKDLVRIFQIDDFISIPLFREEKESLVDYADLDYYPDKKVLWFRCTEEKYNDIFLDLIAKKFETPKYGIKVDKKTQYITGNITNEIIIKIIDYILDNLKPPFEPNIRRK